MRIPRAVVALVLLPESMAAGEVDYTKEVKPLLAARCGACHGALAQKAKLRLDTADFIRKGGRSGPAIVPMKSGESLLIQAVLGIDHERMPPESDGKPLSAEQVAVLRAWIDKGAKGPANEAIPEDPRKHWAFQKPQRPVLPKSNTHPIDVFISAQLAAQGLQTRPEADKLTILRRVTLDLTGLPPTRDQLQAFLADGSANAYEKAVDRLLASPQYGERWGRHWMDVWRYSDWYGRRHVPDVWNSASQIWRWRDWIVQSLNKDHGYDRMVKEMLAADEICPEDYEASVATGYLIRNWYALNPNDWMRNTVEHTGKAFLGLTFNCAHCHDHKYDPISQDDYFRLRAFFEPIAVRQDRVPGEADPGPFQEYEYSTLRKIQRLGAVRIFDKTPDAPTWFYTGGDERNRVRERGSIPPGVPSYLTSTPLTIKPVSLPPQAWYPGFRSAINEAALAEARAAISAAETELAASPQASVSAPAIQAQLEQAETEYAAALAAAEKAGRPGALVGKQSLLLDATAGRRIIQNGLQQLKSLPDGTLLEFQLMILADAHFNFQLAKDSVKGLTAGYVAFEKGRVMTYKPGSFTEFEVGKYDFKAGQQRFLIQLVLETKADRCLLSVRSMSDDKLLVDRVPVALNGWNPVGDATKAISFDARTGSVAAIDGVRLTAPSAPVPSVSFEFESPTYAAGRDVVGIDGWVNSSFSMAPATSVVSATATNPSLLQATKKLEAAKRTARGPSLRRLAAEANLVAARAGVASIEARIAADQARFGPGAGVAKQVREASRLEREGALRKAEADVLAKERAIFDAESMPTKDANRTKALEAATKELSAAQFTEGKTKAALADEKLAETYTPFSPTYPRTSTGRRRTLAEWIASRDNPLTARVAINHIWLRHFHVPLVSSVYDFGRNGAKPSHPELLDWLAVELMESGWTMKRIHRLIVTSQAYRRVSSVGDAGKNAVQDPENRLLWRMNTGRMEAEVVRDSLMFCAGKLDPKMGGQELENGQSLTTFRRSLYYAVFPEDGGKSPLGELFDGPEALECYRRTRSVVPQQALALTNSDLVHQLSSALAAKLGSETEMHKFIVAAFEQILSRPPSAKELEACTDYLTAETKRTNGNTRARESLVRILFNHNDFITIR